MSREVATQHRVEGAGCFARIAAELQALMQRTVICAHAVQERLLEPSLRKC